MTPHFKFSEAIRTATGLGNMPSPEVAACIGVTAMHMERVRELLKNPIRVNSWYRSPEVNKAVKGSLKSDHMRGFAVDFTCKGFGSEYTVAVAIRNSDIIFDQLILEYGWIHISFNPSMRGECLTKKSAISAYQHGLIR
jgi:zinc D-Ala-D-Ala carboxypeptidase